eukprot:3876540-Amphidinium_carterae.1
MHNAQAFKIPGLQSSPYAGHPLTQSQTVRGDKIPPPPLIDLEEEDRGPEDVAGNRSGTDLYMPPEELPQYEELSRRQSRVLLSQNSLPSTWHNFIDNSVLS